MIAGTWGKGVKKGVALFAFAQKAPCAFFRDMSSSANNHHTDPNLAVEVGKENLILMVERVRSFWNGR